MKLGITVPTYFVILGEMFDRQAGINMAEFEFPAYFNFFCLKKRVTLICMPDLEPRVRAIFTETLLGPEDRDCVAEADHGGDRDATAHPKFREEGFYLDGMRRNLSVDTLVQFLTFDARQEVTIDDKVKIKYDMFTKSFRVIDVPNKNKEVAKIVEKFTYVKAESTDADKLISGAAVEEPVPFDLPRFGVTVLGSSHGFDPNGSTTGFVLWINGRGIMVDPPPGSSQALEKLSIPPRFIDGIILTHCHADHDAGTFQKILKDQAVRMYTTQTIYDSFMRKYSAISGFGPDFLEKLFYHIPVKIGVPVEFHGAQINFFYSFHTIPCVSFEIIFEGESMVYSADTNSDPALIEKMFTEGAIGQQRRDMLIEKSPLKGTHSLIFHEAGVPPIHTPMKLLVDLPDWIKEKLFVVHVTGSQIPGDSGLKQANVFDTLVIDMDKEGEDGLAIAGGDAVKRSREILRLVESVDLFTGLSKEQLDTLCAAATSQVYERGTVMQAQGAPVEKFTIFTCGHGVEKDEVSGMVRRTYSPGDGSGENAIVENPNISQYQIVSTTRAHTLEIPISVVKECVTDEATLTDVAQFAELQKDGTWMALSQNMILKSLTNSQRRHLMSNMEPAETYVAGNPIDIQSCGVLVIEGEVQALLDPSMVDDEDDLSTYRGKNRGVDFIDQAVPTGAFLSDINTVLNDKITYVQCEALCDVKIRRIPRMNLVRFLISYPGIMIQLLDTRILTTEDVL
jgi:hypothetical protein